MVFENEGGVWTRESASAKQQQKKKKITIKRKEKTKKKRKSESETGMRKRRTVSVYQLPAKPLSDELYIAGPSPARYRFNFKLKFMSGLLPFCRIELHTFSAGYHTNPHVSMLVPPQERSFHAVKKVQCMRSGFRQTEIKLELKLI